MSDSEHADFIANPGYGELTLWERLSLIVLHVCVLSYTVPRVLLSHAIGYGPSNVPLKTDLEISIQRHAACLVSCRKLRAVQGAGSSAVSKALSSPRFSPVKHHLWQRVARENMLGYWAFRNSYTAPSGPTDSDIVIYFLHGGAYCLFEAGHTFLFLLRVADGILARGLKVSVFALDYSLAPEAVFPTQLRQAAEGYNYLVTEMGVDPAKIVLMGDSAGANLSLGLCAHLHTPYPTIVTKGLAKPGFLFLVSPWVSFNMSNATYSEYELQDRIPVATLQHFVDCFLGGTPVSDPHLIRYTEFAAAREDLKNLLPESCWVSAGSFEVFLSDIMQFVENARSSDVLVQLEMLQGANHDPQFLECLSGPPMEEFLRLPLEAKLEGSLLGATASVGEAVAAHFRGSAEVGAG